MRIPAFPRQSTADNEDTDRTPVAIRRDDGATTTTTLPPVQPVSRPPSAPTETERARTISDPVAIPAAPTTPRARTSFLATLGLVLSVVGALLVLSGPLLGYGIGVSALALVLSITGVLATRKRHVAGKTGALIGVVLSLAAVVIGVLALTGQLWWLDTGTQKVPELRQWLDTQFETRF